MKFSVILVFLSCTLSFSSLAQTKTLGIYQDDDRLGEIIAIKSVQDVSTKYSIKSISEFRIIWSYIVTSTMYAEYQRGKMITCSSRQDTNEEIKDRSTLKKDEEFYIGFKSPDLDVKIKGDITFSTAMLYFEEPVDIEFVFSESYLKHCQLELIDEHQYKLHMPDGNFNYYKYSNGKLKEIVVERSLFDLRFVVEVENSSD